ncbi:MAG: fibronectin type III domain-containing protein [Bacteroidales bacterium]|nr:fibronectin type III domain-containing protein [Bacteroidales bacterium]
MKKKLLYLLFFLIGVCHLPLSAQTHSITVGEGTTTSYYAPFFNERNHVLQHTQTIYPENILYELKGGVITAMTFYVDNNPQNMSCVFEIKLGLTNQENFASDVFSIVNTYFTTVYTGMVYFNEGTLSINFTTPFNYNGGHLVLDIQNITPINWSLRDFIGDETRTAQCAYNYDSSTNEREFFLPKTSFTYTGGTSCLATKEVLISNIENNSATLSWTPRDSVHNWEISCFNSIMDSTQSEWISVVDDSTYTFTDLEDNTFYTAFIRTNCGTEKSTIRTVSFRTLCGVTPAPFHEDFSGFDTVCSPCWGLYSGHVDSIFNGNTLDNSYSDWYFGDSHVFPLGHPSLNFFGNNSYFWLVSPNIDISGLNSPILSFAMALAEYLTSHPVTGSDISSDCRFMVIISTDNGNTWSDTNAIASWCNDSICDYNFNNITNIPSEIVIDLSNYVGQNIRIAFYGESNSYGMSAVLHIHNVKVIDRPICSTPTNLQVATNTTSAELSWSSDAPSFNIFFKKKSETNFIPIEANPVTDTSYTLNGLSAGTLYEWYVESLCADGIAVPSIATMTFSTECELVSQVPQVWDFECNNTSGTTDYPLPTCWNRLGSRDYPCISTSELGRYSGFGSLYSGDTPNDYYVVFPEIDASSLPINSLQLSFFAKFAGYYGVEHACVEIGIMTDPNDTSTFVIVDSISNYNGWIWNEYTHFNIPLSTYQGSGTHIALRFNAIGTIIFWEIRGPSWIFIDDICLNQSSSCSPVEYIEVGQITDHSAVIEWSSDADAFMIVYRHNDSDEYIPVDGNPIMGNSYVFEELEANSRYSFYIISICDSGQVYSNLTQFETACEPFSVPFYENFEEQSTQTLPVCWKKSPVNSNSAYVTNHQPYEGQRALEFQQNNGNEVYAILPDLDVELSNLQIAFHTRRESVFSGTLEVGYMFLNEYGDLTDFEPIWSISGETIGNDEYHKYIVSFANVHTLPGFTQLITFKYSSHNAERWFIDNIFVDYIQPCQEALQLACLFLDTNSAKLTWVGDIDANYNLYYTSPSDTIMHIESNVGLDEDGTLHLTNLQTNTCYTWYVAKQCDDTTFLYSEPSFFMTLQREPAEVPYYCDFENEEENAAWTIVNGNRHNKWFIAQAVNNTPNGYKSLYVSQDSGQTNSYNNGILSNVWAYRDIHFPEAAEFKLSFSWRSNGESCCDYLQVLLGTPTPINADFAGIPDNARVIFENLSETTNWSDTSIILNNNYANTTQRLYFVWQSGLWDGFNPAAAVDNLSIAIQGCARPERPTVSNITPTEATLNFEPAYVSDTLWQIMYDSIILTTNTTVNTLSQLTPATLYPVYVRTLCSNGDTSEWSPACSFVTECVPLNNLPLSWDFESDNYAGTEEYPLSVCWSRLGNENFPYCDNDQYHAFQGYFCLNSGEDPNDYIVILPEIHDSLLLLNNMQISFYARTSLDTLSVEYARIEAGVMVYSAQNSTFIPSDTLSTLTNVYQNYTLSLATAPPEATRIALRFNALGVGLYDPWQIFYSPVNIFIDSLVISGISLCPVPAHLTPFNITHNSATLSWTAGGNETTWNLQYKTDSDDWSNSIAVSDTNYQLTNLTAETTYQVRVQANCGSGSTSDWTSPVSFTTLSEEEPPVPDTCHTPTNLTVVNIMQTTAMVSWTPGGNETSWNLQYRPASVTSDWGDTITTTSPSYTFTELDANSSYQLRVQAVCENMISAWTFPPVAFTTLDVSIDHQHFARSISLMPNPADNYIELCVNSNVEVKEVMVFNAFGQLIQTVELNDNHARIDLSDMASGMYFVRVNGEDVTATKKFIKR